MIFIPGIVIAVATFPGVIVHEAAHLFFCRWRRVAVFEVCFFQFKNPCGYVMHEPVEDFNTAFLIDVGPLIINSLLCVLICFPAFIPVRLYDMKEPLAYVLLWVGMSIGMHAFPSSGDAQNLWQDAKKAAKQFNPLAILSMPLVGLIILANVARFFWFDAIYAAALGLGLPDLILKKMI